MTPQHWMPEPLTTPAARKRGFEGHGRRLLRRLAVAGLGLIAAVTTWGFVSAQLEPLQQVILGAATIVLFVLANRSKRQVVTVFLAALSAMISTRYIFWRASETLDYDNALEGLLGTGLVLAEIYAFTVLLLGYLQTVWPLERKPRPLPDDSAVWPTVDVFIPSYNEDLDLVRATVLAALALEWPPGKLRVYLLDDGRRPNFAAFAAACGAGYITRSDNKHAKAGNLNHALGRTHGDFIAVFDCDHVPTRAFLQITMGWLTSDPRLAFIQTPHHFYSPDPVQRNLAAGRQIPAEGNIFYGLVQDGNDLWNAAFFCGSCAILRREALAGIGGFAVETVTEDAHTALRLHRAGWNSAYLRLPLAAGLGTERLIGYIGQRLRWARGMIQILRSDNPLFGRGLSLAQRLCYFNAMCHFLFAIPRVVLLTAPLAYLLLGQSIIVASPLAMVSYALPHLFHSIATNARINRNWRHSLWSEVYETLVAFFLVPMTIATLINPRGGSFNVTAKSGTFEEGYFDTRAVYPNLVVAVLLTAGLLRGAFTLAVDHPAWLDVQAITLNMFWGCFSLLVVLAALAVGRETRQVGRNSRVPARLPVVAFLPDGRALQGMTSDLSITGAGLSFNQINDGTTWPDGAILDLEFDVGGQRPIIPARIQQIDERGDRGAVRVVWQLRDIDDERRMVQVVFGRADAWLSWAAFEPDRPLASLGRLLVSIAGLFRIQRRPKARAGGPGTSGRTGLGALPGRLGQVAGLLALLLLPIRALGQTPVSGGTAAAPLKSQAPLVSAPATQVSPGPLSLPLAPLPSGTSPTAPPLAPAPSTDVAPNPPAAPGLPAETRIVVWSMRDLGATGPMTMRGDPSIQGTLFGIQDDEVVVDAKLTLNGAMEPALIPELTNIAVTINEQYVGTVPYEPSHPQFGPIELPVNPVFFQDRNLLNFRFTGRYSRDCNDPLSPLVWGQVSDASTLTVTLARLPARRELARLPLPFFDSNLRHRLVLPFILSPSLPDDTVKAAGIVASWFGGLQAYRGANFPVSDQAPAKGNAVLVVAGQVAPPGIPLPPVAGPTIAEVANPNDPLATLLVIAGRTPAEAVEAAKMLVLGTKALRGDHMLVAAPAAAVRAPYDAPAWIATDRPVRFGELVETSTLQGTGYFPPTMHVPFRVAPDLVTWRLYPFVSNLLFRAPPGPVLDVAVSRLDVSINDQFLRSFSLGAPQGVLGWLGAQVGIDPQPRHGTASIPTYSIAGENDLQLFMDARPLDRGKCVGVPQDIHMGIDPDSTIDLSRGFHFATLPNLTLFANSAFPFSRMADLSDTAIVLAEHPSNVEMSAYLNLMGRIGARTFYPATNFVLVRPSGVGTVGDRHLLVLGTLARMGGVADLLTQSPYRMAGDHLEVVLPSPLAQIWRLFGDPKEDERRAAATSLATPLGDEGAAMIGAQSPLHAGRSVVAILAASPQGVAAMVDALADPRLTPDIRGDLVLLAGGRATSFRAGDTYTMGHLPIWLQVDQLLHDRPAAVLALGLLAAMAIALALGRIIPWQRHKRLTRA